MADVTVCIPVLNEAKTIGRVLSAIKNQSQPPNEILIIDGGSTDDTCEIAKSHNVTIIQQSRNGVAAARNIGLARCKSPFFATLDADAVASPDWIETTAELIEKNNSRAAVGAEILESGPPLSARWRERHLPFASGETDGTIDQVPGNNVMFETEYLREIGGWDENYAFGNEDINLCKRLRDAGYDIWYTRKTSVSHYGATGLDLLIQLWRWHTPGGGPESLSSILSRLPLHIGKALKYAFEDIRDGEIWALPLDLAIAPAHFALDLLNGYK